MAPFSANLQTQKADLVISTLGKNLSLDVCSECHPFYTGKQKVLDTGGRIDRFKQRFGVFGAK
ncbi:MAG: 50S ribosomal protein L31 [Pseudomonadales bacterium 32-61-5]|nr:MAG: 50S ribosomal protein L31 [Pseudomonadales bacterium 32-61-5]